MTPIVSTNSSKSLSEQPITSPKGVNQSPLPSNPTAIHIPLPKEMAVTPHEVNSPKPVTKSLQIF
jgi:outer membrane biosynthesis protein TonB